MSNKRVILFTLIAISIGINVYFRLNGLFLHPLEEKAQKNVFSAIFNIVDKKIKTAYPALAETDQKALSEQAFKLYLREHNSEVKSSVAQNSREFKSYWQDDDGLLYLSEVDPYRWHRRVENYLNTGNFGTSRIDGQDRDNLMLAPFGAKVEPLKFHFYTGVYFYKILHFINNKISLKEALAFLPVFLSIFMVLGIFYLALSAGVSYSGSFIASLVICLSPSLLFRSSFTWFDTDIGNVLMPVFIILSIVRSFKVSRSREKISFLFLAGLLTGVYSAMWSVWWLMFYIIIAGLFLYELNIIVYDLQRDWKVKLNDALLSIFLFISFSYFCIWLISGPQALKDSFTVPFLMFSLRQNVLMDNFWPSIAFSITELKNVNLSTISGELGGVIVLCGGLLGFFSLLFVKKIRTNFKENGFLSFVLFCWLAAMLCLTHMAVRFVIFLVIPIGIFFGAFLDVLCEIIKKIKFPTLMHKNISGVLLGGIFITAAILPIHNASNRSVLLPFFNDTWQNMLMKIKDSTPKDAIINAFWESGDFVMTISKRATINCPQYNQTPITYWVIRALLTENEKEAVGILRMLDAGSTHGFNEISKLLNNDKFSAIELTKQMLLVDKAQGRILLTQYTSDKNTIEKILKLMYEPQHPAYFLVENRLLSMIPPVLSPLANWDFKRVNLWQQFSKLKKDEFIDYVQIKFGYTLESARKLYHTLELTDRRNAFAWFTHDASYKVYTNYIKKSILGNDERMIVFDNGLLFDKQKRIVFFREDVSGKWIIPAEIIFVTQKGINEKHNKEGDSGYSCIISEEGSTYRAVLLSKELAHSVLARLYFMGGRGLKHFKLVEQEENAAKNMYLYLFKINWSD